MDHPARGHLRHPVDHRRRRRRRHRVAQCDQTGRQATRSIGGGAPARSGPACRVVGDAADPGGVHADRHRGPRRADGPRAVTASVEAGLQEGEPDRRDQAVVLTAVVVGHRQAAGQGARHRLDLLSADHRHQRPAQRARARVAHGRHVVQWACAHGDDPFDVLRRHRHRTRRLRVPEADEGARPEDDQAGGARRVQERRRRSPHEAAHPVIADLARPEPDDVRHPQRVRRDHQPHPRGHRLAVRPARRWRPEGDRRRHRLTGREDPRTRAGVRCADRRGQAARSRTVALVRGG